MRFPKTQRQIWQLSYVQEAGAVSLTTPPHSVGCSAAAAQDVVDLLSKYATNGQGLHATENCAHL